MAIGSSHAPARGALFDSALDSLRRSSPSIIALGLIALALPQGASAQTAPTDEAATAPASPNEAKAGDPATEPAPSTAESEAPELTDAEPEAAPQAAPASKTDTDDGVVDMVPEPGGIAEPAPADAVGNPQGQTEPAPADTVGNPQGTLAGDHHLRVPVQMPVPPTPAPVSPAAWDRRHRYLDVATDLNALIARDAGAVLRRSFGGEADTLILRGAGAPHLSDTAVTVDGFGYGVPFAGRGVGYADLGLLPVAGIESYRIETGPSASGYAGSIGLRSRRIDGVEGSIYLGERGRRRLSLVAGTEGDDSFGTLAIEARQAQGIAARTTDDRFSLLGTTGFALDRTLSVALNLHVYRDVWDSVGTVPSSEGEEFTSEDFDADPTDGGELFGTGIGARIDWHPSKHTQLRATLAYLDDRFGRYETVATQSEHRDHNRVTRGGLNLSHHLHGPIPVQLGGGFSFAYDDGRARRFATLRRERDFAEQDLQTAWVEGRVHAHAHAELTHALTAAAQIGVEQLTVRRTEARLGGEAQSERNTNPVGSIGIHWDLGPTIARVSWARSKRTHPDAVLAGLDASAEHAGGSHELVLLSESAELGFSGQGELSRILGWAWDLAAYGTILGGTPISKEIAGTETLVLGAEARVDFVHRASGWTFAARGGPMWTTVATDEAGATNLVNALADGGEAELEATGVPSYAMHVGVLRPAARGLVAEAWVSSYGRAAITRDGRHGEAQHSLDGRVGYRLDAIALWLGVDNFFDSTTPERWVGVDRVVPRQPRTLYALLDVSP